MKEFDLTPSPTPLTLEDMQRLTATAAGYDTASDPEAVLRSGLVEEIAEYTWEVATDTDVTRDKLEGELGDVLWYVSEISRYKDVHIADTESSQTLDDFQATNIRTILPIVSKEGYILSKEEFPQVVLAVTALRVVDVMNPKNDDLWLSTKERTALDEALGDLLASTSYIASLNGISLSAAIRHTINKLAVRERSPHVIDTANNVEQLSSRRDRLNIHPFVGQLLVKTFTAESDS